MPDTVQFRNGNQIINYYAADGRKMGTRYFTLTNPVVVPMGETRQWQAEDLVVDETATFYSDNFEYTFHKDLDTHTQSDWISLTRIHNAEGYTSNLPNSGLSVQPTYCYYRKDHLGNNREVWQAPVEGKDKTTAASTIQRTQYYPSGLPFGSLTNDNPERQPYKYNGKEFITMHGYDIYDYGMRGYYAAIMRFTTPDPLVEKYYSVSPYAYCGNNPVNRIDPTGMDYYFAIDGIFLFSDDKKSDLIVIRQPNYYNQFVNEMTPSLLGESKLTEYIDTPLIDMTLSAEAYSNVFTGILSKMDGVDTENLLNGSVSVIVLNDDDFTYYDRNTYNAPSNRLLQYASISKSDDKFNITATLHPGESERDVFGTVSNVQNMLGAHEYMGHGVKGFGEVNAYKYQFKHPSWSKTTENFKREIRKSYETYKK